MGTEFESTPARSPMWDAVERRLGHELSHLRDHWWWFALLGALLVVSGTISITIPFFTSVAVTMVLGILLLASGIATIVGAFWAGRWSGFLVQLLVGILYIICGVVITDDPLPATMLLTIFIAASFIVMGVFRSVGALLMRFPQWGWALLNGVVTFLCGVVIYRQLPQDALWVIGLLVGLEMLFNGWTWIMLGLALRKVPAEPATPARS